MSNIFHYPFTVARLGHLNADAYKKKNVRKPAQLVRSPGTNILQPRAIDRAPVQACMKASCPCQTVKAPDIPTEDKDKDEDKEPKEPDDAKKPSKRVLKRLVVLLIRQLRAVTHVGIATDHATQLVTTEKLKSDVAPGLHHVHYFDEDENVPTPNAPVFQVTISDPKTLSLKDLKTYVQNPANVPTFAPEDKDQMTTALNLMFSCRPQQYCTRDPGRPPMMTSIGANKFYSLGSPTDNVPNSIALESRPGFFRSVRVPQRGQLLLNINTTTSAFYKPWNLLQIINQCGHRNGHGLLSFLRGIRVKTTYLRRSAGLRPGDTDFRSEIEEKIYTVTGLPFVHDEARPANVFFDETKGSGPSESSRRTTVAEFFARGLSLRDSI